MNGKSLRKSRKENVQPNKYKITRKIKKKQTMPPLIKQNVCLSINCCWSSCCLIISHQEVEHTITNFVILYL